MSTRVRDDREFDGKRSFNPYLSIKQGNVMKRLLVLLVITLCLTFAGGQATPTVTQAAQSGCMLVCGDPFIDPNDGQCYQMCCPADNRCGLKCELRPCKSGSKSGPKKPNQ